MLKGLSVIVILLGVAALAAADSRSIEFRGYGVPSSESRSYESRSFESYESDEAKYDFQWAVKDDSSGNDFGQQEAREGEHTQGSYYVQLPDGRLQKVTYLVDGDDGYIADVKYDGEARYDSVSYESASRENRYFDSYSNESK
ncbi:hypothetical protein Pcinc_043378 [Petrolisthes cinctipes]|uniref:Pro-resilin n=1 Tax=Petrolisthes cinctipes TaxID=88211 RepID=A0AAE1EGB2_PETCI|nr:hypothetical protein Pcinc_043378 [Petrolisthes cinctipes]